MQVLAQQLGKDPMQTLQAAASALFRQLIKPDPAQEIDEQVGTHASLQITHGCAALHWMQHMQLALFCSSYLPCIGFGIRLGLLV